MKNELSPLDARIIGCLIEKELTTPDQYPLSLNALVNACNQKTNREPVIELSETQVQTGVDALMKRFLVSDKSSYGHRATKYKHRFVNTEYGALKCSPQELGILCVMLLRGPQTPGELRARTNRLCEFVDVNEIETVLNALMSRDEEPLVARLPRASGARESRYMHLFSGHIESVAEPMGSSVAPAESLAARVSKLEAQVEALQSALATLTGVQSAG